MSRGMLRGAHAQESISDIDSIFEGFDEDKSGFLDIKEARTALRALQERAAVALAAQEEKTAEAARVRRRAVRKTQIALRPSEKSAGSPLNNPMEGLTLTDEEVDMLDAELPGFKLKITGIISNRLNSARQKASARKAEKEARKQRIQELSQSALRRLVQQDLARGWSAWSEMYEERKRKIGLMDVTLRRLLRVEMHRCFGAWVEHHEMRVHLIGLLNNAALRISRRGLFQAWASWSDYLTELAHRRRIEQILKRATANLRSPELVRSYGFWRKVSRTRHANAAGKLVCAPRAPPPCLFPYSVAQAIISCYPVLLAAATYAQSALLAMMEKQYGKGTVLTGLCTACSKCVKGR